MVHRMMIGIVLLVAFGAGRIRAQVPHADSLSSEARDSTLDTVLRDLDVAHKFQGQGPPLYLSPYRGMSSALVVLGRGADTTPVSRHDDAWLRRAQAAFHFTAICGSSAEHECARQNGSLEVTLGAPELQRDGSVVVAFEVEGISPSETEHHALYIQASTISLARSPEGWAVTCHGATRYADGVLTDPLPLR